MQITNKIEPREDNSPKQNNGKQKKKRSELNRYTAEFKQTIK
jgi:hypothetical protein